MKKVLVIIGAAVGLVLVVALVRTLSLTPSPPTGEPVLEQSVDTQLAAEHLAAACRLATVSPQDPGDFDPIPFAAFHDFLEQAYPAVHSQLAWENVNLYSRLYHWAGSDPSLAPIVLLAHIDVVPVDPATLDDWTHLPFSGTIADGFVWGRGTLDDKSSLIGIMEAVENLLRAGWQPERTIYLCFGHDEEIGGELGAVAMAGLLQSRGVMAEFVLDEGMEITKGIISGITRPVASIGIAEKGYMTVELSVETEGGHSSMPPANTGLGILSRAVTRLETNQRPASIQGPVRQLFEALAPEMSFWNRFIFANLWLTSPLVKSQLAAAPITNAMIRTTTAVTMASGSSKENILPIKASMVVNFRLLPGDPSARVLEHISSTIDDPRVRVEVLGAISEPSRVSDTEGPAYRALAQTIREIAPEVLVAPAMMMAATDSRHYNAISPSIFRFIPQRLTSDDLAQIHGTDERLSTENLAEIVGFYIQLLRNIAGELEALAVAAHVGR
ncbi:MAG: M20 family peptidase [Candidatus Neomarinimicrobiota bacterium]